MSDDEVFAALAARIDFQLQSHSSISLLDARSPRAQAWVRANLHDAPTFAGSVVVETRCVEDLTKRILAAGFKVAYLRPPPQH